MGMGANELITLLGGAGSILGELKVLVDKTYGSIRGRTPAAIDGKNGYLIWDHMIWNEITFETDEGKMYSFFTSKSNEETEKVWKALAKKYRPTMSVDETTVIVGITPAFRAAPVYRGRTTDDTAELTVFSTDAPTPTIGLLSFVSCTRPARAMRGRTADEADVTSHYLFEESMAA